MEEADSARLQLAGELAHVGVEDVGFGVHEGIEAEGEVDRAVLDHLQRAAVVDVVLDVGRIREPCLAAIDALFGHVDDDQSLAEILQVLGPAPVPGSDLENRFGWEVGVDPRKQGAIPKRRSPAPPG